MESPLSCVRGLYFAPLVMARPDVMIGFGTKKKPVVRLA